MRFATACPKTFPVRFADGFGKLSTGAKARDCTYTHRCFAPASQAISARAWAEILFLAALWFLLCRHLSGEWFVNEQYGFGWFVPFFALYLVWLRWQDRPPLDVRGQTSEVRSRTLIASAIAIVSLFLLLPVRLFEIANPEWRPLAWIHAIAVVTLTLLLLWYAGGERWLRHFAFPVAFIFVALPGLRWWKLQLFKG